MPRIFAAIPISKSLLEQILEWENKFLKPSALFKPSPLIPLPEGEGKTRWIAGKNLHVTLVPPWEEADINSVTHKLNSVRGEPFEISFNQISFGPDEKEPNLIWATGSVKEGLNSLREKIRQILLVTPEDGRPVMLPHITLARFRPEDFAKFPIQQLSEKVDWRQEVKSFALMRSLLSSSGADYEVLASFALKQ